MVFFACFAPLREDHVGAALGVHGCASTGEGDQVITERELQDQLVAFAGRRGVCLSGQEPFPATRYFPARYRPAFRHQGGGQ